jgi:hypothetical protein
MDTQVDDGRVVGSDGYEKLHGETLSRMLNKVRTKSSQEKLKTSSIRRSPRLDVFNPGNSFTFSIQHTKNTESIKPSNTIFTSNMFLQRPGNKKHRSLDSLMKNMCISANTSPKYIPHGSQDTGETSVKRQKRWIRATTRDPSLTTYDPRRRNKPLSPHRQNPMVYAHKLCGHKSDINTLIAAMSTARIGSNLISTANPRYFIVKEPRWCPSCIETRTAILRSKYPVESSMCQRDRMTCAKKTGWLDGRVASLTTPFTDCQDPQMQNASELYAPQVRAETEIEKLFALVTVEDDGKLRRKQERQMEKLVEAYGCMFKLGMRYEVSIEAQAQDEVRDGIVYQLSVMRSYRRTKGL